jgi:uncharacterized membrane protein
LSTTLAVVLTLMMLYALGWAVNQFIGRKILETIEAVLRQIPLVTTVYGATKQLVDAFRSTAPDRAQKVVLIEFPHRDMKTVGFLTRTMIDPETGQELAAVYVPTAPNPTSGYLEIVPRDRLVVQDWTVDEAITFVISGGTTAPKTIRFSRPVGKPAEEPRPVAA